MIPKIIHQTWRSAPIPTHWRACHQTWKTHHPDYMHVMHSDADNECLVRTRYPRWLDLYRSLRYSVQRLDLIRYMYLHHSGGVYADMDLECVRPLGALLDMQSGVLSLEPSVNAIGVPFLVATYFLAFEKDSPFLLQVLETILDQHPYPYTGHKVHDVLASTGPLKLTECYRASVGDAPALLDSDVFSRHPR